MYICYNVYGPCILTILMFTVTFFRKYVLQYLAIESKCMCIIATCRWTWTKKTILLHVVSFLTTQKFLKEMHYIIWDALLKILKMLAIIILNKSQDYMAFNDTRAQTHVDAMDSPLHIIVFFFIIVWHFFPVKVMLSVVMQACVQSLSISNLNFILI